MDSPVSINKWHVSRGDHHAFIPIVPQAVKGTQGLKTLQPAGPQKGEAEELGEFEVIFKTDGSISASVRHMANFQGKCFYRGKTVILLQNQNLYTTHCSSLNASFVKYSTDISSREMFNNTNKQRKENKACWVVSCRITMRFVKARLACGSWVG